MKKFYFTRHADHPVVETVFSEALERDWEILQQCKKQGRDDVLGALVTQEALTAMLERITRLITESQSYKSTGITAVALLAHAAVLRAAVDFHSMKSLDALIPEEMSHMIDLQADRRELRGDQRFFYVLCHAGLGDLCSEQERGEHNLVIDASQLRETVNVDANVLVTLAASKWVELAEVTNQDRPSVALLKCSGLLCAVAGALFLLLAESEH